MTIKARRRKPFRGISGRFGVEADESVRGLSVPVAHQAYYVSLDQGRWRYWILRKDDEGQEQSFALAVGRLLPMRDRDLYRRLNAQASGPIRNTLWEQPDGRSYIYDLEDPAVVERFAWTCAIGEALRGAESLLSIAGSYGARSESVAVHQDALPNLSTNVSLWGLEAPSQSLVFFPDGILLRRERYQWFVPYAEVDLRYEVLRHPASEATPSDVGLSACGQYVTCGELQLAISDQRTKLQVSNPALAQRAAEALSQLLAKSPRPRVRQEKKKAAPQTERKPARSKPAGRPLGKPSRRAAVGQIVIKPKDEAPQISIAPKAAGDPPSERIVLKIRPSSEAPPPDEEGGLATPEPGPDELDDLGLVFLDEAPAALEQSGAFAAEATEPVRVSDEVRSALGALLAYVAKADDHFSPGEQRLVREILQLPRGFDLERAYEAIGPNSSWLASARARLASLAPGKRAEALAACEAVAACDGMSPQEAARLEELRAELQPS